MTGHFCGCGFYARTLAGLDDSPIAFNSGDISEEMQTAMDFKFVVEYVGPEVDGEVFEATVVGTAAEL